MLRAVTMTILGCLLLVCPAAHAADAPASAAGEAGHGRDWESVTKSAASLKSETQAQVRSLGESMAQDRQALLRELRQLKEETARSREQALALQAELRRLRDEEGRLNAELAGQRAVMSKIENNVRDNAGLLLAGARVQPGFLAHPEWRSRLEAMTAPDRFPPMEDVSFLLDSLLTVIAHSGEIVRNQERIYPRAGSASTASVLRLGALQAAYALGDEAGFLQAFAANDLPRSAAYIPDSEESELILAAVAGAPALPMDFSGGALLRSPPERRTMLTTLRDGGFFLWPILLIGLVGAGLVVERCIVLGRIRISGKGIAQEAEGARGLVAGPTQRVVARVLGNDSPSPELMEKRLEEAILDELPPLERFLQTLRVLAAVAPLLGLLGTVSGIIQTFRVITLHGNGDPKLLSAGISEALLTTEFGLLVAIPLLLSHHFLTRRMNSIVLDMETAGTALITGRLGGAAE